MVQCSYVKSYTTNYTNNNNNSNKLYLYSTFQTQLQSAEQTKAQLKQRA